MTEMTRYEPGMFSWVGLLLLGGAAGAPFLPKLADAPPAAIH